MSYSSTLERSPVLCSNYCFTVFLFQNVIALLLTCLDPWFGTHLPSTCLSSRPWFLLPNYLVRDLFVCAAPALKPLHLLLLFPFLTLFEPHWPPHCSLNTPDLFWPYGLYTGSNLFQDCSSPAVHVAFWASSLRSSKWNLHCSPYLWFYPWPPSLNPSTSPTLPYFSSLYL